MPKVRLEYTLPSLSGMQRGGARVRWVLQEVAWWRYTIVLILGAHRWQAAATSYGYSTPCHLGRKLETPCKRDKPCSATAHRMMSGSTKNTPYPASNRPIKLTMVNRNLGVQ